jgi:addiction module RelE/StbE family toxin
VTDLRWTQQAVSDLEDIRRFISRDSPGYGRLVAERIYNATERIAVFPFSGREVPEIGREGVREIILGEYRIVYQLQGSSARILTVFRSSRLFPLHIVDE